MAVLGTTDISTTLVRNTLGEDNNDVGTLCISPKVNMWSKRKPFRDSRTVIPVDEVGRTTDGNWGMLEIPSYNGTDTQLWVYDKPIDSVYPKRLGDFRGYYHNALIPITLLRAPASVTANFRVEALVGQSSYRSLTIGDFFDSNMYFGVEIFDQNGNQIGWGSGKSGVDINLSNILPKPTEISAKFFLTNALKDFVSPSVQHLRWALPRERLTQNRFWSNVPINYNPPTLNYFTIEVYKVSQTPYQFTIKIGNIPLNVSEAKMIFRPTQGRGTETFTMTIPVTPGNFENTRYLQQAIPGTIYDVELYFPPDPVIKRQTVLIAPIGIEEPWED